MSGRGTSGWVVAGIFNNETSVRKYGRKALPSYQIPGFFSNEDAGIIGRSLLERLSEPETSAMASHLSVKTTHDFLKRGVYRFICNCQFMTSLLS